MLRPASCLSEELNTRRGNHTKNKKHAVARLVSMQPSLYFLPLCLCGHFLLSVYPQHIPLSTSSCPGPIPSSLPLILSLPHLSIPKFPSVDVTALVPIQIPFLSVICPLFLVPCYEHCIILGPFD